MSSIKTVNITCIILVYVIAASLSCDTSQNLEVETVINEELQTDQHIESKNVVNIGTKVGNQIPDFTIVYEDGTEITSASLIANGKPVFMFFAATWCPSCTRELHELKEIYPEFSNDIEFITIGVDPTESIETLAQYKHQIGQPWPIAKPIGPMISDLKILSQSAKVAFNSNGIITYRDGYGKGNRTVWREWMENNGEGF